MDLAKWARKRAEKKRKSGFKFSESGGFLDIAVVCETGEWFVWKAEIVEAESGSREDE